MKNGELITRLEKFDQDKKVRFITQIIPAILPNVEKYLCITAPILYVTRGEEDNEIWLTDEYIFVNENTE